MNRIAGISVWFPALVGVAVLSSCDDTGSKDFLGSGVVEVETYQVATTVQGTVMEILKQEGEKVSRDELVAVIDSVPLGFQMQQLEAGIAQVDASIAAKRAEVASIESDIQGLDRERKRVDGLVSKGSLPQQKADEMATQAESANLRAKAAGLLIRSMEQQRKGLLANQGLLADQIGRCGVRAAASGVVITRYRNTGEVIGPGQPIYEVGVYDTVDVDFFAPQPLLADVKLGQQARIRMDEPGRRLGKSRGRFVPATIVWVSEDAEFSPKNIQTRDARNDLVFKVRVRAANADGALKRGLPVEVWR